MRYYGFKTITGPSGGTHTIEMKAPKFHFPLRARAWIQTSMHILDRMERKSRHENASLESPSARRSWIEKKIGETYRIRALYWESKSDLAKAANCLAKSELFFPFEQRSKSITISDRELELEIGERSMIALLFEDQLGNADPKPRERRDMQFGLGEMRLQMGDRWFKLNSFQKAAEEYSVAIRLFGQAAICTTEHLGNSDGALEKMSARKVAAEAKLLPLSEMLGDRFVRDGGRFAQYKPSIAVASYATALGHFKTALGIAELLGEQGTSGRIAKKISDAEVGKEGCSVLSLDSC